jgi:hypothetical protein
MAGKTLAGKASLVIGGSGGIGLVVAALRKFHASYTSQVMKPLHNPSATSREVAIRPLCQPE